MDMKKILISICFGLSIYPHISIAKETVMCGPYVSNVERKVRLLKSYGPNLSKMARNKLYEDLKFDTEQCLAECEGNSFRFCNGVALAIEGGKPL